jgi:hypothetical protein
LYSCGDGYFAFLSMDRLKRLGYQLHLGVRRHKKHVVVEVDCTPLVVYLIELLPYFLFGLLLIPKSRIKSSNKEVSTGWNIIHFPS